MTNELQYNVKLRASFKLNNSENLLIWFEWQSVVDNQSFLEVNVMGRK